MNFLLKIAGKMMRLKLTEILRKILKQSAGLNSQKVAMEEPTSSSQPIQGLFGNLLLQTPKGFQILNRVVEKRSTELVQEIVLGAEARAANPQARTTVELVDDLSNEICSAADLTDCVRCMHSDPEFTRAAEESMRFFTCLVETLNTTPELYGALKNSLETEKGRLDPVSMRTANLLLEDFELSGVLLDDSQRSRFVQLSDEIFDSGSRFMAGCERPVVLSAEERAKIGATSSELNGSWSGHKDFGIRRFTHAKFFGHCEEQELQLKRLISARHQIARLTKFPTFAHRAQSNSVLCTYENVRRFLLNTIKEFSTRVDPELEQIHRVVRENSTNFDPAKDRIGLADVEFAALHCRQQLTDSIGMPQDALSTYFHLGTMLEGFEQLVAQLYGLHFRQSLPAPGECWPGNVLKLEVYRQGQADENGGDSFLGTIFLDVDARPDKMQGECHFTVRCSKLLENGDFQTPIVLLSLSIVGNKNEDGPNRKQFATPWEALEHATLSPQQADCFFHEMGHAMHSILGRTRFQHVAGTRCPTDFAEVPSHLMECFFNDSRILQKICRNKSGQTLGEEQVQKIIGARKLFNTTLTLQQALYSLFDLELHGERAEEVATGRMSTTELFGQLNRQTLPQLEYAQDYAYHHRITHLVTYGAKYYSYLVARAGAELIYQRLFSSDPFSRQNGQQWAEVQSKGGEYPSDMLLAKALGTSTTPSAEQLTAVLVGT